MNKITKFSTFLIVFMVFLQFFCVAVKTSPNMAAHSKKLTSAEAMAVLEVNSGRMLYSKDKDKHLPMASTTKIITAICAIENTKNLDEKLEIPKEAVGIEGSSIYLKAGEHLTMRELLYGLMLRSGNDSAVAIAIAVSGSVAKFVELMNSFCKRLNLNDTHIVTVNGLHDDSHYTSADNLARATAYALKNPVFSEIVSTKEKSISAELDKKYGFRFLKNKNKLLNMIDGADGVKTGYTKKAGRCFVGSATRKNMQVVCVVLNCAPMFEETANLIERAFDEFKMTKLFSKGCLFEEDFKCGKSSVKLPVNLSEDIFYPLKSGEISDVKGSVTLCPEISLPTQQGAEIGKLEIRMKNDLIFSQKLYTIKVEKQRGENYFKKILEAF